MRYKDGLPDRRTATVKDPDVIGKTSNPLEHAETLRANPTRNAEATVKAKVFALGARIQDGSRQGDFQLRRVRDQLNQLQTLSSKIYEYSSHPQDEKGGKRHANPLRLAPHRALPFLGSEALFQTHHREAPTDVLLRTESRAGRARWLVVAED